MQAAVGYLVAIIVIVLVLNLFFTYRRVNRNNTRIKRGKQRLTEEQQAHWRDREIARRLAREQEDAVARINLRNETLSYYDEVRRRHEHDADDLEDFSATKLRDFNETLD